METGRLGHPREAPGQNIRDMMTPEVTREYAARPMLARETISPASDPPEISIAVSDGPCSTTVCCTWSATTCASYPAPRTASRSKVASGTAPLAYRMRARSVARFTDASTIPGTFRVAFSTRRTHDAQVMPVIWRITSSEPGSPAARGVREPGKAWSPGDCALRGASPVIVEPGG